ncbi:MAG TPA: hypothetical protein VGD95_03865, partial [Micavibrio sp.]
DAQINQTMARGLRDTVQATQAYMRVTMQGYSPAYRAQKLLALANQAPHFVTMCQALEGDKKLSPLFDRILDREYRELYTVIDRMRETIHHDSRQLAAMLPSSPTTTAHTTPAPTTTMPASPRPPLDPLSFGVFCLMLPFAVASGIFQGVAQGLTESNSKRAQAVTPPSKKPLLSLVPPVPQ